MIRSYSDGCVYCFAGVVGKISEQFGVTERTIAEYLSQANHLIFTECLYIFNDKIILDFLLKGRLAEYIE